MQLPEPVHDLVAVRVGEGVELHFTVPRQTTDGGRVRSATLLATLCRSESNGPCLPFAGGPRFQIYPTGDTTSGPEVVGLHDDLSPGLRSGPPRLLVYRVEFFNAAHRSAGPSEPVYTAAGGAPPAVADLRALGSREGTLLQWQPDPQGDTAQVLLRRETLGKPPQASPDRAQAPKKGPQKKSPQAAPPGTISEPPGTVWLQANAGIAGSGGAHNRTLDDSAVAGQTYSYAAQRQLRLQLGGHGMEMRSRLSAPVTLRLLDTYPPPAPTGLTAAGFNSEGHYAVDLIWEPVDDRAVVGYIVTRTPMGPKGIPIAAPSIITTAPVDTPSFHDATPVATQRYRYEVVAIDGRGNRSAAVSTMVEPPAAP